MRALTVCQVAHQDGIFRNGAFQAQKRRAHLVQREMLHETAQDHVARIAQAAMKGI